MLVIVGRIGRAHGIRGEVAVQVHTDDPDGRFAVGSALRTEPPGAGPLVVAATRWHSGRLLIRFQGVTDRSGAEALRGVGLLAEQRLEEPLADPEEFYDNQLVGLTAVTVGGESVGVVSDVIHLPGQDLLAVRRPGGAEALVPFVADLVPAVDLPGRRLVIDPPKGLLDPLEDEEA